MVRSAKASGRVRSATSDVNIPVHNLFYLLSYAWGHADAARDREAAAAPVETLADLLAHVLAHRVGRLLKSGLDRSYVEERVVFSGVRGKLELGDTVKRNLLSQARTACTVEELTYDIPQNRILRGTLESLLALPDLSPSVRAEVGIAYRKLEGIQAVQVRRSSFRKVRLHRNNRPYQFLMDLCRLIHESLFVQEDGSARFADLRRRRCIMARVFEDFVANFYRAEQSVFDVAPQTVVPWHEAASPIEADLSRIPRMIPDVVLESEQRRIILDTKYYRQALAVGRFGGRRVRSSHLYQVFAYIENRNAGWPGAPHEGILLYPVVEDAFAFDLRLKGHRIQVRSVDLDQEWAAVHEELLSVLS